MQEGLPTFYVLLISSCEVWCKNGATGRSPRFCCTTFGKVVLDMARDSFYSEVSVSPYKRDGKQVGWKGTLHYLYLVLPSI